MTAAFVLGFIAGLATAALAAWLAVKEIEGIQMSKAPRYRLVGYDIGTAPDENGGWVHWTDHEAIVARLTAERDSAEAYAAAGRKMAQKTANDVVAWKARAEKAEAAASAMHRLSASAQADAEEWARRCAAAEAERDAALAGAVKVRPLVWPDFRDGGTCGHPHHFQYFVTQDHHGSFWAHFDLSQHDNLDAAKRHCDQHYQRAAIHPDPEARQAGVAQCCMCGKNGLSTAEDGGPECELHDGRWVCGRDCYDRATEGPDARQADLAKAYGPILDLLPDAVLAAEKAMRKYPQPNYVISKWAEETGEVTKDLIHMAEGRQTADKLRGEIVQSLAMLHRLMVEGDQVHGLPPVGPQIRALTPPADLAAKIGGE